MPRRFGRVGAKGKWNIFSRGNDGARLIAIEALLQRRICGNAFLIP